MNYIDDKFIGLDMYGTPISVNYRGESSYNTRFGALLSLISWFLLIAFAIDQGIELVNRQNPQITILNEVTEIVDDDTEYNLKDNQFILILDMVFHNDDHLVNETFKKLPENVGRLVAW